MYGKLNVYMHTHEGKLLGIKKKESILSLFICFFDSEL